MTRFLNKHKFQFIFVVFALVLLLSLTSCRFDSANWYSKVYTSYGQEWVDMWNGGKGAFNSIFAWPVNLISWPIAWLCSTIGKAFNGSFFMGILFTTLIVRTCAWPIYSKQNGMSLKMQLIQPEMTRIQQKYGARKDPASQQAMQKEMMALYKKYGVNPLGCFGTMFLQFPIFMAMFEVVKRINQTTTVVLDSGVTAVVYGPFALADTKFHLFGLQLELDTSFFDAINQGAVGNAIFAAFLALAFGGLTILQQYLGQKPPKYQKQYNHAKNSKQEQSAKQMKYMMYFMNIMFVFMSLQSTSLALYWLIGAGYQILQSFIGRKLNERKYYKMQEKQNM